MSVQLLTAHPVKIYNNVDHKLSGMRSQIEKNLVELIFLQINVMGQNEEIYKSMLGMTKYQEKIVQLLNKLPAVPSRMHA